MACFGQLQGGSGVSWATEVMTGYVYNITLYHPIKKLGLTWVNNQTTVFFSIKIGASLLVNLQESGPNMFAQS